MKGRGFTIVELLVVIVVIAILAAITIVAYNGIQTRAQFANTMSDLKSLQKVLELYRAQNGSYPSTGAGTPWFYSSNRPTDYIPGVVPDFINALPQVKTGTLTTGNCYIYRSNGTDYKLMRILQPSFSAAEQAMVPDSMKDDYWTTYHDRYGYWSSGGYLF
jgi:type II secretion system protein G